jgi:hypothetical protein
MVLTVVTRLLLLLLLLLPLLLAITQYTSMPLRWLARLLDAYLPLLLTSAAVTPLAETPALVTAFHHTPCCTATCYCCYNHSSHVLNKPACTSCSNARNSLVRI